MDSRGEAIAELFNSSSYIIENDPSSPPTLESKNGRSWIDLKCTSPSLTQYIQQWSISEEETASDHKCILTDLFSGGQAQKKRRTQNGCHRILETLKSDRWLQETSNTPINSITRLQHVVNHLYDKITSCKEKHFKPVNNQHERVNPWWTTELEIERQKVRAQRRRYQKAQGETRKNSKQRTTRH